MIILDDKLCKLPILPQKVFDLLLLKDNKNYDSQKLLNIIENDAILTARLLTLSNSEFFGFYNKIETPQKALNLYGMNFTISILVCELINNSIKFDLSAYNIGVDSYNRNIELTYKLLYDWIPKKDAFLKEDLIIPLYVSNLGRILFNQVLKEQNKLEEFSNSLILSNDIISLEKSFFGYNHYEMSAIILHKWGFDKNLIKLVARSKDENNNEYKRKLDLLRILDILLNIKEPFSKKSKNKAIEEAKKSDFDYSKLEQLCNKLA